MNNSEIKTNLNKILKSGKNFLDLPVCIDFYVENAPLNTETFEYYLDGMILDTIVFDEDELIEDEPVVKEYPPAQLMIDSTVEETVDEVVSNIPPPIEEPTVSTKKARPTRPNQKKPNVPNEVIPKQKKRGGFFNRQKNKK